MVKLNRMKRNVPSGSGLPLTSGTVKTPTMSWFCRRSLYTSTANWLWPIRAILILPLAACYTKSTKHIDVTRYNGIIQSVQCRQIEQMRRKACV